MNQPVRPVTYLERIDALKAQLEAMQSPVKLDLPFTPGRAPTQAFSEFLTNKEQGDWAERTFIENFNSLNNGLWATKYGRSEDLIAGEPGFDAYYAAYQDELKHIGKRPDVLIFDRARIESVVGLLADISMLPIATLDMLVPGAKGAIEVRSSAFLSEKYRAVANAARNESEGRLRELAGELLSTYRPELLQFSPEWLAFAEAIHVGDMTGAAPRALGRKSTGPLRLASQLTKDIKACLNQLSKRSFLSITPKAEDMSLVYRWLQRYPVPHHYCQVFFDRAVLLPFERILELLADPTRENRDYFIEADEKNQGKVTFKIDIDLGTELMRGIEIPRHSSAMKELPQGRLLFYVRFEPSSATFADPDLFSA